MLLFRVFSSNKLHVSIDRVCRKLPYSEEVKKWMIVSGRSTSFMHWDESPNRYPKPREVQGLVALTDTDENMGGFHCLPSLYSDLENIGKSRPTGKITFNGFTIIGEDCIIPEYPPNLQQKWPIVKVPMKKGDLLIWDCRLPHGNGVNTGLANRYCQYVTMYPASKDDSRTVEERRLCWVNSIPPSGLAFAGDPRKIEQEKEHAILTRLGEQLLGIREY